MAKKKHRESPKRRNSVILYFHNSACIMAASNVKAAYMQMLNSLTPADRLHVHSYAQVTRIWKKARCYQYVTATGHVHQLRVMEVIHSIK